MTHTKKSEKLIQKFWELQRAKSSKKMSDNDYLDEMKYLFNDAMSYVDELESKLRNIKGACSDLDFK